MKVHVIVDYSFLYYKYKFQMLSGRMARLTAEVGDLGEIDTSIPYYSIREIESFRKEAMKLSKDGTPAEVTMSICFDMPSNRKEEGSEQASEYKSNRNKVLDESDFNSIELVKSVLEQGGYNVFKIPGYEADDIVTSLVERYKGDFDQTIIYTPDTDLLVNVTSGVWVKRYKSGKGYSVVAVDNFEDYTSREFKCFLPYNAVMLFKCTVGDKSDCIKGINRFGAAAFEKMIANFPNELSQLKGGASSKSTEDFLEGARKYLGEDKYNQAMEALALVKPRKVDTELRIDNVTTNEKWNEVFRALKMNSLLR